MKFQNLKKQEMAAVTGGRALVHLGAWALEFGAVSMSVLAVGTAESGSALAAPAVVAAAALVGAEYAVKYGAQRLGWW